MADPWAGAKDRMNNFFREDPQLRRKLAVLTANQSHELALETALEEGRIYGLRQIYCEMRLQRDLNKVMSRPPVERSW